MRQEQAAHTDNDLPAARSRAADRAHPGHKDVPDGCALSDQTSLKHQLSAGAEKFFGSPCQPSNGCWRQAGKWINSIEQIIVAHINSIVLEYRQDRHVECQLCKFARSF